MNDKKALYWLGFRHTRPSPPGKAVVLGPFNSHEEAIKERERSKAWDCSISPPFIAESKEEAESQVEMMTL